MPPMDGGLDAGDASGPLLPEQCRDEVKNGFETGTDCGGPECGLCAVGAQCIEPGDCESGVCGGDSVCAMPSCDDSIKNGSESDVDCGGSCPGCEPGGECGDDGDCDRGACESDNRCGCTPLDTAACGTTLCGQVDDGCGGMVDCSGQCSAPDVCNQGSCCTPLDATACNADECGMKDDGCGGMLQCPDMCQSPATCNGSVCEAMCDPDDCPRCPLLERECCKSDNTCGCERLLGGNGCG